MAPQPLTVGYRLIFKYTVNGFQHKQQNYLEAVVSGDPSGFDAVGNGVLSNAGISAIELEMFSLMAPFFGSTGCTFDGWELQKRIGTVFSFLAAGATSVVPSGGSANVPASMVTLSGKDALNRNLPYYLYESRVFNISKVSSYSALSTDEKALVDAVWNTNGGAVAADAYNWRLSRDGEHADRWLAEVLDSNEKLRRLRHLK
jgi:hypothetical protein